MRVFTCRARFSRVTHTALTARMLHRILLTKPVGGGVLCIAEGPVQGKISFGFSHRTLGTFRCAVDRPAGELTSDQFTLSANDCCVVIDWCSVRAKLLPLGTARESCEHTIAATSAPAIINMATVPTTITDLAKPSLPETTSSYCVIA